MRTTIPSFFFIALLLSTSSCVTYPSLLNYQQAPRLPIDPQNISNFEPLTIQANDILQIRISSSSDLAIQPFSMGGGTNEEGQGGSSYDEFLVNSEGNIEFPTLGTIAVKGLTTESIKNQLLDRLNPYFEEPPIVQVQLTNFRVNVNGEVARPGSFTVNNGRLTIIEALTMAGDFTPYSRRDSVLIIREENGLRSFGYVDFYSAEVFESDYFYLQQNDVVYVQPQKTKVNSVRDPSSRFLPWVTAFVSLAALVISINR